MVPVVDSPWQVLRTVWRWGWWVIVPLLYSLIAENLASVVYVAVACTAVFVWRHLSVRGRYRVLGVMTAPIRWLLDEREGESPADRRRRQEAEKRQRRDDKLANEMLEHYHAQNVRRRGW